MTSMSNSMAGGPHVSFKYTVGHFCFCILQVLWIPCQNNACLVCLCLYTKKIKHVMSTWGLYFFIAICDDPHDFFVLILLAIPSKGRHFGRQNLFGKIE